MEKKAINVQIGHRIQKCREAAGLTQEVFAELIDVGVKHLSAIECGANGISIPKLLRVCEVLSVPADAILHDEAPVDLQSSREKDVQELAVRLARLNDSEFKIAKNVINNVFAAFALK